MSTANQQQTQTHAIKQSPDHNYQKIKNKKKYLKIIGAPPVNNFAKEISDLAKNKQQSVAEISR